MKRKSTRYITSYSKVLPDAFRITTYPLQLSGSADEQVVTLIIVDTSYNHWCISARRKTGTFLAGQ
jgi:hypothetical protein